MAIDMQGWGQILWFQRLRRFNQLCYHHGTDGIARLQLMQGGHSGVGMDVDKGSHKGHVVFRALVKLFNEP